MEYFGAPISYLSMLSINPWLIVTILLVRDGLGKTIEVLFSFFMPGISYKIFKTNSSFHLI